MSPTICSNEDFWTEHVRYRYDSLCDEKRRHVNFFSKCLINGI